MSSNNQLRPATPQLQTTGMSPESAIEIESTQRSPDERTQTERLIPAPTVVKPQERNAIHVRSAQQSVAKPSRSQAGENGQKTQQEDVVEVAEKDDDDAALSPFDWADLESRYRQALIQANEAEDLLNDKFDSYADAFQIWSQTSAHQDNERAQKRLKTRTLHVQLSEYDLENKKQHYVNVVEAFKNALNLLRNPSGIPLR